MGKNPPSLTWDEVAWGYNAYSLGIDGKDEFGRFLPIDYLESFGDFKPPVYAYLDILPIKLFGLNEFSTRFPSAFFGVLTVLLTYFLTKRIIPHSKELAIFSSLFLAISPWHINLSRAAFEANVASFFIVAGVWLFLKGVQEKNRYIVWSVVFFVISMYTFNTARIVSPLLVIVLGLICYKQLLEIKKIVITAIIVGLFLILPTIPFLLSSQASLRFKEVNIFSDAGIIRTLNQEIENDGNIWWSKIIHNRRFTYSVEYIRHYIDNLSPSFLFIKGDGNPKFSIQDVGQLYLFELPFLIFGILLLFKKREGSWLLIPIWAVIGILPAATARETPHALRIETTLPTFQILTAYGFISIMRALSRITYNVANISIKYILFSLCFLLFLFNFLYYVHSYYAHYPFIYSGEWQYGYKDAITYTQGVEHMYDKVVITESLGRPYMYTLFYTKETPSFFRNTARISREVFGFVHVEEYGKYRFAKNIQDIPNKGGKVLYVDVPSSIPPSATILKTFNLLNGNPILKAYTR